MKDVLDDEDGYDGIAFNRFLADCARKGVVIPWEDVGDWLEALGASRREIARACRVVLGTNKGFTYSNSDLRMSVVCISHASSREQWWDTVAHEVDHLQTAILDYYQVEPGTEDAAWLQGYLVRQIVISCEF